MMFVACGLNHKTAPLHLREQMALSATQQESLLSCMMDLPFVNEAALLSTCNRTEIYCHTSDVTQLIPWLADQYQLSADELIPYCYIHQGIAGIRHALSVASGLDSMMLGEPQILGQMKNAYQQGCRVGSVKQPLQSVFQFVFRASKRIRNGSGIGQNPISIAYVGAQLIGDLFPDYNTLRVFLIGSGETASLVAKYLQQKGVQQFMVASRTKDNSILLANSVSAKALTITDIPQYLPEADVIISATSCPLPFITKPLVEHALQQRQQAPLFFLDLAIPRDIEPEVGQLPNVRLYNIDDLQDITTQGIQERRVAAEKAKQLIDLELDNYLRWHRSRQANKLICDYRSQMQKLTQLELQRAVKKLATGSCQYSVLSEFSDRLLKKLTHTPTVGLRQAARENRNELLDLAHYLLEKASYEKIT